MAESNLLTTGEELDLNNEPPVTGERRRPLYDSFEVVVRPFGRIIKYIFNHVHLSLKHLHLKVLRNLINRLVFWVTRILRMLELLIVVITEKIDIFSAW